MITSSKPIAVISGHTKVAIMRYPDVMPPKWISPDGVETSGSFLRNNVHDALLPQELAGTEFVTIPTMYTPRRTVDSVADLGVPYGIDDNRGDVIRFNAIEDGTELSYVSEYGDSVPVRTLHANESYIVPTQIDAAMWRTSKPATCALYGKSWANIIIPTSIQHDGGGK
ncbi:MAG: IgGFc-binding protein [Bacteroidetes bacterium]|nr:IgGFc-binding protein [Bacteroidota bacterium]